MPEAKTPNRDELIADAILALATEVRILSFGKDTSITPHSKGAIEDLSCSVADSGRSISGAIADVAQSLTEVAEAIKTLAEAVDQSRKP